MKELVITPPPGYEIDRENSTLEKIVFKEVKKKIEWKDFGRVEGYYISIYCEIHPIKPIKDGAYGGNKNTFPTKEEAEACLALSQLLQWRNKRNEGWKPDWDDNSRKDVIYIQQNKPIVDWAIDISRPLYFRNTTIAKQFLKDFRDLIEVAKPLL